MVFEGDVRKISIKWKSGKYVYFVNGKSTKHRKTDVAWSIQFTVISREKQENSEDSERERESKSEGKKNNST